MQLRNDFKSSIFGSVLLLILGIIYYYMYVYAPILYYFVHRIPLLYVIARLTCC